MDRRGRNVRIEMIEENKRTMVAKEPNNDRAHRDNGLNRDHNISMTVAHHRTLPSDETLAAPADESPR
uniref:DUF2188 domain-containing protein n=1 Tax=Globodera pallida TaxID=36090 RepID=A0A183C9I3_GLOPA